MELFKQKLNGLAMRTGLPVGVMATVLMGVLLLITQLAGAAGAFVLLLVIYLLLWFIFGKFFFQMPPN